MPPPTIPEKAAEVQAPSAPVSPAARRVGRPGPSASTRADAVVAAALAEWVRWGRLDIGSLADGRRCLMLEPARCEPIDDGCGQEQDGRWCALVNDYWAEAFVGSGRWFFHDCRRVDVCRARWPVGVAPIRTPAWSAAFVSTVMARADLDDADFPRTPYHVDYVLGALDGHTAAYRVEPLPAAVARGDLICNRRRGGAPVDAGNPIDPILALRDSRSAGGPTPMHCDIVVEVDRALGSARAIGGNLMQTVARVQYRLDRAGRVPVGDDGGLVPVLVLRLATGPDDER